MGWVVLLWCAEVRNHRAISLDDYRLLSLDTAKVEPEPRLAALLVSDFGQQVR